MRIPLPPHSYQLRAPVASVARLVNCFPVQLPAGARAPYALSRAPGIASGATLAAPGACVAMTAAFGYLWIIAGSKLVRYDYNANSSTVIGDIGTPGRVDMAYNLTTIVVVNEPNAFYYDTTDGTFGQITDVDFTSRGASDVEFIDNYLLFVEPDSGRFFGADVGTATSFDSLNFATAEGSPDNLVGLKVDHRQAILFGESSTEIWELTGGTGFPFARVANGFIEQGCINGRTAAKLDNSVYWLADDYTVRRLEGTTPVRVSQEGIEQRFSAVTIDAGHAFAYSQEGHLFYVLTFPEATFVYDATTKEWHERQTYGQSNWIASCHARAFGKEWVGHGLSNQIGTLDPQTYTEFGETQRMSWTYQAVYAEGNRAFHDRLEIIMQTGEGLTTGQGSDPEIMLDVSDDGGSTWKSLPNRKIGKIGEYSKRVFWSGLGSSYQRVYRGSISDPVQAVIVDTQLDARGARPLTRRAA